MVEEEKKGEENKGTDWETWCGHMWRHMWHRDKLDATGWTPWEAWCGHMWHRDRLDAIGWAAFLIWGALVLLAETTKFSANFNWWNGWRVFFAGVGIIVILGTVIRLCMPQYKRSPLVGFIFGFILLAIGLGGWAWIWPLALFAIAITILVSVFKRRR